MGTRLLLHLLLTVAVHTRTLAIEVRFACCLPSFPFPSTQAPHQSSVCVFVSAAATAHSLLESVYNIMRIFC